MKFSAAVQGQKMRRRTWSRVKHYQSELGRQLWRPGLPGATSSAAGTFASTQPLAVAVATREGVNDASDLRENASLF